MHGNNFWMYGSAWVLIPIVAIVCGSLTQWLRIKHGYAPRDRRGRRGYTADLEAEVDGLTRTVRSHEATIAKLEERVRVLERIATDASTRLGEEIDRLRA